MVESVLTLGALQCSLLGLFLVLLIFIVIAITIIGITILKIKSQKALQITFKKLNLSKGDKLFIKMKINELNRDQLYEFKNRIIKWAELESENDLVIVNDKLEPQISVIHK